MLKQLRQSLKKNKLDGWLQNRSDIFLNEYSQDADNFLTPLSGFTGSAGLAVVLMEEAFLLVDGRYDVQAMAEVDENWQVMGPATLDSKKLATIGNFLLSLDKNDKKLRLGFYGAVFPHHQIRSWQKKLAGSGITLQSVANNFVAESLSEESPALSPEPSLASKSSNASSPEPLQNQSTATSAKIFDHDIKFSGLARLEKIKLVGQELKEKTLDGFFIGDNANLSWLLNLRSNIIPYNPVVTGFGFIDSDQQCDVFLPDELLLQENFDKQHITCHSLSAMESFFDNWQKNNKNNKNIALDDKDCSHRVATLFAAGNLVFAPDPITHLKSIKNATEIDGARAAHLADGVAMVNFLYWLDESMTAGDQLDEKIIAQKLWACRAENKNCQAPSFETIPALSENAALPHYQTTDKTNRRAKANDILLLDSGAHYFFGTTDITRTICLTPRALTDNPWGDDFALNYIRTLKGHLAIARARFPLGVSGAGLDPLARQFLWAAGLDYNHGTGHGIGSFLPVHEGPQYISGRSDHPFAAGMLTSNEPGFYHRHQGKAVYGIRIENVELCVEVGKTNDGAVLGFETLTLCPIDTTPLHHQNNLHLLTGQEKKQLNDYHQKTYDNLSPHLSGVVKTWLAKNTKPI